MSKSCRPVGKVPSIFAPLRWWTSSSTSHVLEDGGLVAWGLPQGEWRDRDPDVNKMRTSQLELGSSSQKWPEHGGYAWRLREEKLWSCMTIHWVLGRSIFTQTLKWSKHVETGFFDLPSGKLTVCYWKWPSRNSWFSHEKCMVIFNSYVNVYQNSWFSNETLWFSIVFS
jgi:hypothetical protein